MKYVKRITFFILILITVILVSSWVILRIEANQTSYLNIENNDDLNNNSYLIKNVNVIPMNNDTVFPHKTVRIENGVIEAISDTNYQDDIKVIDGKGGFLSPGLIDMHVHLWDRYELGLYLANGVTTVRNLLGMPMHLEIKDRINTGKLLGPILFSSSPQFTGENDKSIEKKQIHTAEEAEELVRKYKKQGYDYIKTYNRLPEDIFDATLEQSVISEIPVVAHPSFNVAYKYHFDPRISTVEHTEDIVQQALENKLDSAKLDSIIQAYAASDQTHTPTLTVFFNITEILNKEEAVLTSEQALYVNPFMRYIYMGDYEKWTRIKAKDSTVTKRINNQHYFHIEIIKKLHNAGVKIVCGSDAGVLNTAPGFSIHQELAFYKMAGMNNYESLKTATVNPSTVYPEYEKFGTIETGKFANLILTSENPLDNLATLKDPQYVFIKGRLIDEELMHDFKKKAFDRQNFVSTLIRFVKYILWGK
ncbi:MAG: amidohydrolase family protein [Balneolaceae bacterium]|nr:amidohydrolase family protein [Balneolaceae bacterium]